MTDIAFTPTTLSPLEDLKAGLARLIADGWVQGYYECEDGCCATGALQDADYSAGVPYLRTAIIETGWEGEYLLSPVTEWADASVVIRYNDSDGRTWPEIRAVYEAAIELAQVEEDLL